MILPDVNLLVYAYNTDAPWHQQARRWWEICLDGSQRWPSPGWWHWDLCG